MIRFALQGIFLIAVGGVYPCGAEVFRCPQSNGLIAYQDYECASKLGNREVPAKKKVAPSIETQEQILDRAKSDMRKAHEAPPEYRSAIPSLNTKGFSSNKLESINQITTYATFIGRGIACGAKTDIPTSVAATLIDKTFTPGSSDHQMQLVIFAASTKYHATLQQAGKTPSSCTSILREFTLQGWR